MLISLTGYPTKQTLLQTCATTMETLSLRLASSFSFFQVSDDVVNISDPNYFFVFSQPRYLSFGVMPGVLFYFFYGLGKRQFPIDVIEHFAISNRLQRVQVSPWQQ